MKHHITTPIYYVNDSPHIGHAYTSIIADIFSRNIRVQEGESNVFFLTGTDEHGQKIEQSAQKKSINPQSFCDEISIKFKNLTPDFNLSNNYFIRTTDTAHKQGVQKFWLKLEENGWIYKDKYCGWYAVRDEAFYSEEELVNGKAPTGADVEWQEEESYFFKLSAMQDILLEVYHDKFVFPSYRLNEVKSFVTMGLKDLSISRTSFKWGIEVPSNKNHVIYVWLDALTNYITALGYPDSTMYKDFWLSNSKKIHFIGKDILRFHAIFWPAFIIAEKLTLDEVKILSSLSKTDLQNNHTFQEIQNFFKNFEIVSHGWWKNNGEKMSKSLNNAINPYDLKDEFGLDKVRYFFLRNMPFGNDGDFIKNNFIEVTNADLANNIGNLTQRVMSFIYNNCDQKIPSPSSDFKLDNFCSTQNLEKNFNKAILNYNFEDAINEVLKAGKNANQIINSMAPWNLKKEGKIEEMNNLLFAISLDIFTIYKTLECIMPSSAKKGLDIFNGKSPEPNQKINKPEPIFMRI
jgi:methionyl-tRNA synthetase